MSSDSQIFSKVASIIAQQINVPEDTLTRESTLDSLGVDSLDRVEIVMKLEEEFGIEIGDEDAEKIQSLEQAVNYIEQMKK